MSFLGPPVSQKPPKPCKKPIFDRGRENPDPWPKYDTPRHTFWHTFWHTFGPLFDQKSLQMPWFWFLGPPLFLGRFGPQRVPPHCVGITPFLTQKWSKNDSLFEKNENKCSTKKGTFFHSKRESAITKGIPNKMHYDLRAREETCFDHFLDKIHGFWSLFGPPFWPKIVANFEVFGLGVDPFLDQKPPKKGGF